MAKKCTMVGRVGDVVIFHVLSFRIGHIVKYYRTESEAGIQCHDTLEEATLRASKVNAYLEKSRNAC